MVNRELLNVFHGADKGSCRLVPKTMVLHTMISDA